MLQDLPYSMTRWPHLNTLRQLEGGLLGCLFPCELECYSLSFLLLFFLLSFLIYSFIVKVSKSHTRVHIHNTRPSQNIKVLGKSKGYRLRKLLTRKPRKNRNKMDKKKEKVTVISMAVLKDWYVLGQSALFCPIPLFPLIHILTSLISSCSLRISKSCHVTT